jgi:uncharacterized membrane protein YczE
MLRRSVQFAIGIFLYGFAIGMMLQARIGVSPWDVLSQGVALRSGLPFGLVTNIIGALVLLLWIPIRQRPGWGTVLNVLFVGYSAQLALAVVPVVDSLWIRVPLFAAGLLLLGLATGLYLGAHFGPGPRDGLMTGIHRRTGWPLWIVRAGIELVVLAIGWVLGGDVGVGTLAFALLIGPVVQRTLPPFDLPVTPRRRRPGRGPGAAPERPDPSPTGPVAVGG